jgi:hypothetical protein
MVYLAKATLLMAVFPPHKWYGNEFSTGFEVDFLLIAVWLQPTVHRNNKKDGFSPNLARLNFKSNFSNVILIWLQIPVTGCARSLIPGQKVASASGPSVQPIYIRLVYLLCWYYR